MCYTVNRTINTAVYKKRDEFALYGSENSKTNCRQEAFAQLGTSLTRTTFSIIKYVMQHFLNRHKPC